MKDTNPLALDFSKLQKALTALEVMAVKPMQADRGNIDATIQRFEFTIELFWKLLKHILEEKGVEVQYPKDVLRAAYAGKLIDQEDVWLNMLKDRNLTSHTYNEELADVIFKRIQGYLPALIQTFHSLKNATQ